MAKPKKENTESAESGENTGGKGKILIAIGIVVLLSGGAGTGYYLMNSGDEPPESVASETEGPIEPEIGETLYLQLESPFLVNLMDSELMMQVKLALRTPYGQTMVSDFSAHEFGIRAAFLEELAKIDGRSITSENFRKDTAARLRDVANAVLEEQNIYSGVDLVLFTEFLVQ